MKIITCICCPKGCSLDVDDLNGYTVTGNACKRGEKYGVQECKNPVRMVTSTVAVKNGEMKRCPVKTFLEVPKDKTLDVAKALNRIYVQAPIKMHQVIVANVANTGVDIIATRAVNVK